MGEAFQVHGSWKTEVRVQEPCQGKMFVRDKGEGGASRGGRGFTWKMLPLGWDCQKGRGRKGGKREEEEEREPQFPCLQSGKITAQPEYGETVVGHHGDARS